MPVFWFLNLIIHSLVFGEFVNDRDQIIGFAVTSDNASEKGLYYVELGAFINLMRDVVGRDSPTTFVRRQGGGAWLGDGEPPPEASIVLKAPNRGGRRKGRVK